MLKSKFMKQNNHETAYGFNMPGFLCADSVDYTLGLYDATIAFNGHLEPNTGRLRCQQQFLHALARKRIRQENWKITFGMAIVCKVKSYRRFFIT